MNSLLNRIATALAFLWLVIASPVVLPAYAADDLAAGFQTPPDTSKPWCYWYWISDNISKDGITRDLEAMSRAGIGGALIGNIFLEDVVAGDVKVLSEAWWKLIEHAIREGGRTGVDIGMFNCPGWSQSGGPWIAPEQAMRYLVSSETRVEGPVRFEQKLTAPVDPFQEVVVIAFPAPSEDRDSLTLHLSEITFVPGVEAAQAAADGRVETAVEFPAGTDLAVEIDLNESLVARHLSLIPSDSSWAADCELLAEATKGEFRTVKSFRFDRSNMAVGVGPMPRGRVTVAFEPVKAKRFRLVFRGISGAASLAEIELSGAAKLQSHVEKQLGKMHPTPLPQWDTYRWPAQIPLDRSEFAVSPTNTIDLSEKMDANGVLRWDVPPGDWVIMRTGMTTTGTQNSPASPEGQGLEVDKMSREAIEHHFDSFIGQILQRMPAEERTAFKYVVADSYEQGSQNWSDDFASKFRTKYGYDPVPWLPVLTGRVVGNVDRSDRFLWDLRRLVADSIAADYVGGLREKCHQNGLTLWLENYGHWGFPAEFLQYGGASDLVSGEFWTQGTLGSIECRAASSAANTYGKPMVSAEAFTSSPSQFKTVPSDLKARGDWAFSEGINHFVLHVYVQQPWEDRKPGVNAWFGTEFNRHNTWFEKGSSWFDYVRRCCYLLQQGNRVADVAYFIGEDTPQMTGARNPELPVGYDFDYINAEVIIDSLSVKEGQLVLPHGTSYRVLVLPDQETMRPKVLTKIHNLIQAGATVIGRSPLRSPSMENYPQSDTELHQIAHAIWGTLANAKESGTHTVGEGRVIWGRNLNDVFDEMEITQDFLSETSLRYSHRTVGGQEIYFVANPESQPVETLARFRVGNRAPSLWWPTTGEIDWTAIYEQRGDVVSLPLRLPAYGSLFVVFGEHPASQRRIVSVLHDKKEVFDVRKTVSPFRNRTSQQKTAKDFTIATWVNPSVDISLVEEQDSGTSGLDAHRNEIVVPTHGHELGGDSHAGCGISVGRNGVCVFEHSANYLPATLRYEVPINDWTHVAIVYHDNQPHLYLNGEFVHAGLKSRYTVHPGNASVAFDGSHGSVDPIDGVLNAQQIRNLMQSTPYGHSQSRVHEMKLLMEDNLVEGLFWENGEYSFVEATGKVKTRIVSTVPSPIQIDGPWSVTFRSATGGSTKRVFDELLDWTKHTDDEVRYFSGTAIYQTTFTLASSDIERTLRLDLGKVGGLVTARLNGKDLGTRWIDPLYFDLRAVARSGANVLEIEVVNPWYNRLVGDAKLSPDNRRTFLMRSVVSGDDPLQSAGLLGPVRIYSAEMQSLE